MKTFVFQFATLILYASFTLGCSTNKNFQVNNDDRTLKDGWTILSSKNTDGTGDKISKTGFDDSKWFKITVPSTAMAALIANKKYPDVFMGDNISKVDTSQFRMPWWYRNEFVIEDASKNVELIFEGINYRANVWLNGSKIASSDTLFGAFRIFKINISKYITKGKNALAVEVIHPNPDEPTVGFVDWSPMPPDREMGIWRPVKLKISGKTSLDDIFVESKIDNKENTEASLYISATAVNNSNESVKAVVKGKIENIIFEKTINLKPNEKQEIVFTPREFSQLVIKNPRLWWPHDLGQPELYNLNMQIETGKEISYSKTTRFGIREVKDYFNEKGYRGYKINGVELLIKGGGWVDGMFLNDTEEKVKAEMEYVKHANMNTIRLEGFWGNSERFYELADELGLLLMTGWSCQWEWQGYLAKPEDQFMSIRTPEDINLILNYTNDHIRWLRNHPSIFVWVLGSDKLPRPELEEKYYKLFAEIDTTRPLLMSCSGHKSSMSGKTAVKMNGPYDYVSPNYWYIDTAYGGAYGFNTETGPGPQIPSLEIVKTMIPENKLWPINEIWNFHCGRHQFGTLDRYLKAFNNRYGLQNNVEDFCFKNQASNLEAMRAMYEAFAVNREKTTGIIQWMYNSAWPKLIWQFWDYNLMPNAAFYGARIGARPLNIAYNYGDHSVYLTNLNPKDFENLNSDIKIYDLNGKIIAAKQIKASVKANSSVKIFELPDDKSFTNVYFLSLKLSDKENKTIADNFYWLSKKKDVPDFKKSEWFYTPLKEYADFRDLDKLPKVGLIEEHTYKKTDGKFEVTVKMSNPTENIAFLIELNISGDKSGKSVVPILWDDNYFSLIPGEKKEIKAGFSAVSLNGEKPVLKIKGWNLK